MSAGMEYARVPRALWYDRLLRLNRGGSVILVQLENEYPPGWTHTSSEGYGTDICNGNFQNLRDKAVALGIQVPCFFSGMHHSGDPAEYNGGRPSTIPREPAHGLQRNTGFCGEATLSLSMTKMAAARTE